MAINITNIVNQKTINYAVVIYAFLLPLSRAGVVLFSAVLFLLWIFSPNFKTQIRNTLQNKVLVAVLLFIGFSIISLSWSNYTDIGLHQLRKYWYLLPVLLFATQVKSSEIPKVLSAFLAGMFISEIISYGIFFEIIHFKNVSPMNPSPFMHHIHYSMFLAFASLLLLNRFYFETDKKWKIFYFLYFLTTTSNLFLNGGRTGQLAFIVSIFVVGFLNLKNKLLAFTFILTLTAVILFAAYQTSPVFKSKITQTFVELETISSDTSQKYTSSFGLRLGAWIVSIDMVKDKPIFGTGIGEEMESFKEYIKKAPPEFHIIADSILAKTHLHNSFITYLVQLGFIGLFLYLNIFYQIYKLKIQNKELSNLKYVFLVVFTIAGLVEQIFISQFTIAFFTLFVGIFISANQNATPQEGVYNELKQAN